MAKYKRKETFEDDDLSYSEELKNSSKLRKRVQNL
jgi:hypothetical protein